MLTAGPAYGGHHQPATALACHRHAGAACETNNDHRSEFTREGASGREGVSRCRHFFARAGKKCRAVDGPATLAANPRESLPSFPSGPSVALAATPRTRLTQQLLVEKSQKSAARQTPTAGFRLKGFGSALCSLRKRLMTDQTTTHRREMTGYGALASF
jgi:hypothetical protein